MSLILQVIGVAASVAIVAASFIYLVSPRQAGQLLKKVGITLAVMIFGAALFQHILTNLSASDAAALVPALLLVSLTGYLIREARNPGGRERRKGNREGGAERTRLP